MYWWLLPLSWIYDGVTSIRNFMYDRGILQSRAYGMPVICVGNLAVGGTGKTPFIEYVIRLLQADGLKVAVLSRGYKRKSSGFVLADDRSTALDIGDEPYQIKRKFPTVAVAVDADRCEGIHRIMTCPETADTDVVLLDDAFQHRRVRAGLNILLTDCHRLYTHDRLLPCGRLRENAGGGRRADVVIATKVTEVVDDAAEERVRGELRLEDRQSFFFSGIRYGNPYHGSRQIELDRLADYRVLLLTGIANPSPLTALIGSHTGFRFLRYADHHAFTQGDYRHITEEFNKMPGDRPRVIITTEKDMARLDRGQLPMYGAVYAIPIEVEILNGRQTILNNKILDYVRENSRDNTVPEREDEVKS